MAQAEWRPCCAGQVQVMLLGTFHMTNPGRDLVNVEVDDMLAPQRQAELQVLSDRLVEWRPDRIAVEVPHDRQTALNELYRQYQAGVYRYDQTGALPEPFSEAFVRNEAVQIGFRVADHLGHDGILSVDDEARLPDGIAEDEVAAAMQAFPNADEVDYELRDPSAMQAEEDRRLQSSTVSEYLDWLNREPQLSENHAMMFAAAFEHERTAPAVAMLAAWYERNIRIVRTLWRSLHADVERVLLVFGAGHVRVLRHLINEAPMLCAVSPLPYLSGHR